MVSEFLEAICSWELSLEMLFEELLFEFSESGAKVVALNGVGTIDEIFDGIHDAVLFIIEWYDFEKFLTQPATARVGCALASGEQRTLQDVPPVISHSVRIENEFVYGNTLRVENSYLIIGIFTWRAKFYC